MENQSETGEGHSESFLDSTWALDAAQRVDGRVGAPDPVVSVGRLFSYPVTLPGNEEKTYPTLNGSSGKIHHLQKVLAIVGEIW